MAEGVVMPKLGLTATEGTVSQWLVDVGEEIQKGQAICEIETEKVTVEVEAPFAGTLLRRIEPGVTVPVGEPIAVVGASDEDPSGIRLFEGSKGQEQDEEVGEAAPSRGGAVTKEAAGGRRSASPIARRLARDHGVDLEEVKGTGPGGRITREDVAAASEGAPEEGEAEVPSRMRAAIAATMTASSAVPQFALEWDVDVTATLAWLEEDRPVRDERSRVTLADVVIAALARSLAEHPQFLRSWEDGVFTVRQGVDIGLAVAVEDGLIVPVLRNADMLRVEEIAKHRRLLQERAASGRMSAEEVGGGVFSVSNLGPFGVHRFHPLLNPPEAGILGLGAPSDRDGRPLLTLTLVVDHRVANGAEAAQLLSAIAARVEDPNQVEERAGRG